MMETKPSDPFLWDVDRVVQELCTPNRSWQAPPARKLPDPAYLEAVLREREVDGETLLTYGEEFKIAALWKLLGIKKAPHQLSINAAIKGFQKRSPGFRQWKQKQRVESQSDEESPPPDEPVFANGATPEPLPSVQIEHGTIVGVPADDQPTPDEQPAKKKRAVLTQVSPNPVHTKRVLPPTEGDTLHAREQSGALTGAADPPTAYLGHALPSSSKASNDSSSDGESREISWVRRKSIVLPGRRLQVSRLMRRRLLTGPFVVERTESKDDGDEILPLFGESDDEESIDSETWKAFQKEEERIKRREARKQQVKDQQLTSDKVAELVEASIQRMESEWSSKKSVKYEHKARKLWDYYRQVPDRLGAISRLKEDKLKLDERIERITGKITGQDWLAASEVEEYVPKTLRVSVDARQYQRWLIQLVESPRQPPRMRAPPRPATRTRRTTPENSDEDDESLSSGIDDSDVGAGSDLEDLVIRDAPSPDPMEIDSPELVPRSRLRSHSPAQWAASDAESDQSLPKSPGSVRTPKSESTPAETLRQPHPPADDFIEINSSPQKPLLGDDNDDDRCPSLDDVEGIEKRGVDYWKRKDDRERLVIAVLAGWKSEWRTSLLNAIKGITATDIWDRFLQPVVNRAALLQPVEVDVDSPSFSLARLFDCYISCTADRTGKHKFKPVTLQRLRRENYQFSLFCGLLQNLVPYFLGESSPLTTPSVKIKVVSSGSSAASQEVHSQASNFNVDDQPDEIYSEESELENDPQASAKKRRRHKPRDKAAQELRMTTVNQKEEFERRRLRLRRQQEVSGDLPADKSRLIVNETKEADQALIYINESIGKRIQEHQIEGVRFLWDHIVKSNTRQGCLLSHSMGLGKTMQVITLLVVIAEAAASGDLSVSSQIPDELRKSKTLILCPSGLIDNWVEEVLTWAPANLLGDLHKLDKDLKPRERIQLLEDWAEKGGLFIVGYDLFTRLASGDNERVCSILHENPSIVIADEGHYLKNTTSQRHIAASNFKTTSRIALTATPLTKNVEDYFAMINWVAPNYLGDISEFRARFEKPIKEGLYADSDAAAKRRSRKMLHILNETVAPKVNRKDVQVLLDTLPGKKEFAITLPLTEMQFNAYSTYLDILRGVTDTDERVNNTKVWKYVGTLSSLLTHPQVFKKTLEDRKINAKINARKKGKNPNTNDATVEQNEESVLDIIAPDLLSKTLATVRGLHIGDFALSSKVQVLFRILDECKKIGDKVLVFSQSIPALDFLTNACKVQKRNYKRLDGSTPGPERQRSVKEFNTDPTAEVYLISSRAGGVGLNIYGANRVVIFDFKFTPADEQQAVGRAYRIGQTKPVFVYWLVVGGTFEDVIFDRAVFKMQLASRVVDKKKPDPYSKKLSEYFRSPSYPSQEDLSDIRGKDRVLDALITSLPGLVRKVEPTETFEKEEVYELPPEDQQEAEKDIQLERLRIQNPEEYRRQTQPWLSVPPSLIHPPQMLTSQPSTAPPRPISMLNTRPPNGSTQPEPASTPRQTPVVATHHDQFVDNPTTVSQAPPATAPTALIPGTALPVAQPLSSSSNVLSRPQGPEAAPATAPTAASPEVAPGPRNQDPAASIVPPLTLVSATPSGQPPLFESFMGGSKVQLNGQTTPKAKQKDLEPILGTGTFMKDGPEVAPASGGHEAALLESLSEARKKVRHLTTEPQRLAVEIIAELDKLLGSQSLPKMDKLQYLNKRLREEPRLAQAVLARHLKPEHLASMDRQELIQTVEKLRNMDETEFHFKVWGQKKKATEPPIKTEGKKPAPAPRVPNSLPPRPPPPANTVNRINPPSGDLGALQQAITNRATTAPGEAAHKIRLPPPPRQRRPNHRPGDSVESPHVID